MASRAGGSLAVPRRWRPPLPRRPPPRRSSVIPALCAGTARAPRGVMIRGEDGSDPRLDALMFGLDALDDRALVGVLLGRPRGHRGVEELAAGLLERTGGVAGMARCGPSVFASVEGIGVGRALRLAAAVEVGRRLATAGPIDDEPLSDPARVAAFLTPRIGRLVHEEMWVLSLDGAHRLRGLRRVAQGGLHAMSIAPGDVLRAALWDGATSFLLAHNHPSGRLEASREDIETTLRLSLSASQMGVPLVDHVIVTASGEYVSMVELGVLEQPGLTARRGTR